MLRKSIFFDFLNRHDETDFESFMAVFRLFGKIISANKIGEAVSTRAWLIHHDRIFYPFFPGAFRYPMFMRYHGWTLDVQNQQK